MFFHQRCFFVAIALCKWSFFRKQSRLCDFCAAHVRKSAFSFKVHLTSDKVGYILLPATGVVGLYPAKISAGEGAAYNAAFFVSACETPQSFPVCFEIVPYHCRSGIFFVFPKSPPVPGRMIPGFFLRQKNADFPDNKKRLATLETSQGGA